MRPNQARRNIQVGDYVTVKHRVEAYHSKYAGNPEMWLEPGQTAQVSGARCPTVTKSDKPYNEFLAVQFLSKDTGRIETTGIGYDNVEMARPQKATIVGNSTLEIPTVECNHLPYRRLQPWADQDYWDGYAIRLLDIVADYTLLYGAPPWLTMAIDRQLANWDPDIFPLVGHLTVYSDRFQRVHWHRRLIAEIEVSGGVADTTHETNVWISIKDWDEESE